MHVASERSEQFISNTDTNLNNEILRTDFQKTADDIILRKYTPAGVIVNEAMDILHFRGNTSSFLEQSPGKPSHNLLQMAKNGLSLFSFSLSDKRTTFFLFFFLNDLLIRKYDKLVEAAASIGLIWQGSICS